MGQDYLPRGVLAACVLALCSLSAAAKAETACESDAAAKHLPPLPRGCHWQRIQASGGLSFGVLQSAGKNAEKAWRRQVIVFFGERYSDWDMAACKKVWCVQASVAGSRRCTYSGFPCASDGDRVAVEALSTQQIAAREQPADRELTASEIKEMQELLARAGYRVWADGIWGDASERALAIWQRRNGLPDNGNASLKSLDELRQRFAVGAR